MKNEDKPITTIAVFTIGFVTGLAAAAMLAALNAWAMGLP